MPSCVALGCHRRGETVLKIFPRKDRRRRQIWVDRVNRPGWTPTKYSALCEHHFDRDQWELPREDGKRKLKDSALPTAFVVPPTHDDGGVSSDHSYCLPLYRKIFEDSNLKADIPQQKEETMPIEHVKVEEGENENFTPETMDEEDDRRGGGKEEEEDRGGGREEEELSDIEEDVESIQCTPDISVFPEHGEPFFPIEMVDCESDDANTFMAEPDNDPLAISAEDQVQAATLKPYFGNSQKFLFIPKETKVMVNICSKATGEPEVNSSESTSAPNAKPTLKVRSLDGLLDPNVVMKSSSSNSASVNSNTVLKSPSAVYLKEKLTLSDQAVDSSVQKLESSASSQKLEFDQKVVTLTSPKFNFPPKLKVTSTTDDAPPKLNLVSTKLAVQQDEDFIRKMPNLKLEKPVVLQPMPNILVHKPRPNIMVRKPSDPNVKLQPGLIKSGVQQILADKNIKIAFKPGDDRNRNGLIEQLREINNSPTCIENYVEFKKVLLDSKHNAKKISKQVTMDGIAEDSNRAYKQIGNNLKAWLDSNIPPVKKNSVSHLRTILPKPPVQNSVTLNTKNSSVIVLKPFGSRKSPSVNSGGISPRNLSNMQMQVQNQSITMYKCDQCQIPFISPFALQVHKQKTGHVRNGSQGKNVRDEDRRKNINDAEDFVIVETSESSNDSSDSQSEDDDSSVVVLSEDDSETDATTEEISGPCNDNSNESDSGTGSSAEEGEKEFEVTKKSVTETNILNKFPRQLDNSLVKIPNLGALRNLKSYEFLKLSNMIDPHSRESMLKSGKLTHKESNATFDGNRKSEALSFRNEQKLDENRAESVGHLKENQPTSKVKLTRENLLKNKIRVSQTPINCISKMDHGEASQNEVEKFKDNSEERELIVLSSSSSSSGSHSDGSVGRGGSSSDDDESGDDETSSEDDASSNGQRYPVVSISEVNTDRISELIKKKKEVELKDEVLKLKDNTKKPIVLLPRIDHMKNNVKKANNCRIDTPERASEIVISDDEETNCRQKPAVGESIENSVILNGKVNSDNVQEEIPVVANVSKEETLVDLTLTEGYKIKKMAQSEKPVISLSQSNLDETKGKNLKRERVNIEIKNVNKSKEDELITIRRVNKPYSKEMSCVKRKIKDNPSSNTHSVSLPPKVKGVESKTRNIVVSNNKRSCYEKYKMAQLISQTNQKRITRKSLKNLEGDEEGSKFNLNLKRRTLLKKVEPNDRNKNSFDKSPIFQTRKCKLCGETVLKAQFKQHVYQHMDMTSVCKVCKKRFPHSVLLHRHMKNEH